MRVRKKEKAETTESSRPSGPCAQGERAARTPHQDYTTGIVAAQLLILTALLASACSGNSPTAPTPPTPTPTLATVTGHLTATNGGQALPGVSVAFGAISSTTDTAGTFSGAVTPTASMRAVMTGSGILPRTVYLSAASSRDVAVDAFALAGGFDPTFYRSFVRDGFDHPSAIQPLRRLTAAPVVYVRSIDEAGRPVDAVTLRTTIDAVWSVGSSWTGGAFGIVDVPSGTEDHTGQAGWLTVKWIDLSAQKACGQSDVGRDGGVIKLSRETLGCACNGSKMRPRTVRHELGHAFGFWHTGDAADLMSGLPAGGCDTPISAREQYHAALAYRRPVGNADPDADSPTTVTLAPMRVY